MKVLIFTDEYNDATKTMIQQKVAQYNTRLQQLKESISKPKPQETQVNYSKLHVLENLEENICLI